MAKKASTAKAGGTTGKRRAAKSKSKAAPRKPARAGGTDRRKRSGRRSSDNAADALFKLLESPLVADLLAVGATAALAAIAETRYSRRSGADAKSSRALKAAAKAAAAAIGRRLSTEVEEIRKASKARSSAKA